MSDVAIVMTTLPASSDLARRLVEERLAACAQEAAIAGTYRWEGEVRRDDEMLLLIKTASDRIDAVTGFLAEHHPYEVPEIVVLDGLTAAEPYLGWLLGETRPEA